MLHVIFVAVVLAMAATFIWLGHRAEKQMEKEREEQRQRDVDAYKKKLEEDTIKEYGELSKQGNTMYLPSDVY